jgi:hypothetical protein
MQSVTQAASCSVDNYYKRQYVAVLIAALMPLPANDCHLLQSASALDLARDGEVVKRFLKNKGRFWLKLYEELSIEISKRQCFAASCRKPCRLRREFAGLPRLVFTQHAQLITGYRSWLRLIQTCRRTLPRTR